MNLTSITGFRLTSFDPKRLAAFYAELGFSVGEPSQISSEELELFQLSGRGMRTPMTLGGQRVDLDSFDRLGRPYPANADAASLVFQHLAIVTDDAHAAWRLAKNAGATAISRNGAVTLPPSAGGVTAVKFRDPEGHPLEFLQFPDDHDGQWQGEGMLGIDHSAISVSDLDKSKHFYQTLGLCEGEATLNHGRTQDALDGLSDVCVDVMPLLPPDGAPHLELLHYRTPARAGEAIMAANDVAATRIIWASNRDLLLRDPDGHLHQLERRTASRQAG